MNDRFKFRVFISDKKNSKNSLTGMFKVHSLHTGTNKAIITSLYGNCSIKLENNVLMQCTGLKDKNGKLIYEGDIVSDKSNHIRVVVWEQDCFKYPALKTSRYFHRPISNQLEERKIGLRGKLTFQDAIGKCDKKHFEVIGNIYENKELLEEE